MTLKSIPICFGMVLLILHVAVVLVAGQLLELNYFSAAQHPRSVL